jgi:DNA-binding LacI/PurR family transcriptional regulator
MGYKACQKMIEEGVEFDGIFAVNDRTCAGVMAALHEHKIKIPEEVAVIGFNDEPYDVFLHPPLSTIKQPSFEIGRTAAHIFLEEREFDLEDFIPKTRILNTQLIQRGSTVDKPVSALNL